MTVPNQQRHYVRRLSSVLVCLAVLAFTTAASAQPTAKTSSAQKAKPKSKAAKRTTKIKQRRATRHSRARSRASQRRARRSTIVLEKQVIKGRRGRPLIEAVVEKQPFHFESGTTRYAPRHLRR